jgi:hypothetical protein
VGRFSSHHHQSAATHLDDLRILAHKAVFVSLLNCTIYVSVGGRRNAGGSATKKLMRECVQSLSNSTFS